GRGRPPSTGPGPRGDDCTSAPRFPFRRAARSADERLHGARQALVELHARLEAEHLARRVYASPGVPDVTGPRREVVDLRLLAENLTDRARDRVDGRRRAGRDVQDAPVR